MSSHTTEATHDHDHDHGEGMTKKKIWKIFWVLLGITTIEFFIALYCVPHDVFSISVANPIYIVLTLAKAFYIVAYFMHLKFEKVGLVYSIIVPILFIIGLILVLTNESHHWSGLRGVMPE